MKPLIARLRERQMFTDQDTTKWSEDPLALEAANAIEVLQAKLESAEEKLVKAEALPSVTALVQKVQYTRDKLQPLVAGGGNMSFDVLVDCAAAILANQAAKLERYEVAISVAHGPWMQSASGGDYHCQRCGLDRRFSKQACIQHTVATCGGAEHDKDLNTMVVLRDSAVRDARIIKERADSFFETIEHCKIALRAAAKLPLYVASLRDVVDEVCKRFLSVKQEGYEDGVSFVSKDVINKLTPLLALPNGASIASILESAAITLGNYRALSNSLTAQHDLIRKVRDRLATQLDMAGSDASLDVVLDALTKKLRDLTQQAHNEKAAADQFFRAWTREIGPPYANKRHSIDMLVMTTKQRMEELSTLRKEKAVFMQSHDVDADALDKVLATHGAYWLHTETALVQRVALRLRAMAHWTFGGQVRQTLTDEEHEKLTEVGDLFWTALGKLAAEHILMMPKGLEDLTTGYLQDKCSICGTEYRAVLEAAYAKRKTKLKGKK